MSRATTLGDYQVLKFDLGEETYCVNIDHVDEIVNADVGELTTLPNQPAHVEGVVDLRGRTTTVVDPRTALGLERDGEGRRIVVFDSDGVLTSAASEGSSDEQSESDGVLSSAASEGSSDEQSESDGVLSSAASEGSSDEQSESDGEAAVGWLVEEAHQVTDVLEEDVDRSVASEAVLGIVRQDGGFVVWVDPDAVHG